MSAFFAGVAFGALFIGSAFVIMFTGSKRKTYQPEPDAIKMTDEQYRIAQPIKTTRILVNRRNIEI